MAQAPGPAPAPRNQKSKQEQINEMKKTQPARQGSGTEGKHPRKNQQMPKSKPLLVTTREDTMMHLLLESRKNSRVSPQFPGSNKIEIKNS